MVEIPQGFAQSLNIVDFQLNATGPAATGRLGGHDLESGALKAKVLFMKPAIGP
jgi:hypothetical protein